MKKIYAADYRKMATENTQRQTGILFLIAFLFSLIEGAFCAVSSILSNIADKDPYRWLTAIVILIAIATVFADCGFIFSFIFMAKKLKNGESIYIEDLFKGFNKNYWKNFLTYLVGSIFVFLWSLLLIIPGIVKSHSYAMTLYIKEENPDMDTMKAITASRRIMDGHKWEYFCMNISYIGWHILAIFTLGILEWWILPKQNEANYLFYLHISEKDVVPEENK